MHENAGHPHAIDLDHLTQQTFGDSVLARELLALFEQQCLKLRPVILGEGGGTPSDPAHTLKGGARAVGAFPIAGIAERIEAALDSGSGEEALAPLCRDLDDAIAAYRLAVIRLFPPPL